jgi:membrane protease subunit (stomatin/prohibitin family)
LAFYVNLKEIPNNRFGTQSVVYWDDAYLNAQVGAVARGSYSLQILDPILLVKKFVPLTYLSHDAEVFDFSDSSNAAATQLFNEVVSSLAPAFSHYANDPDKGNRITRMQSDTIGFAESLIVAVEENYRWAADRGLGITKVALQSIDYDDETRALLSDVKKADSLSGARGNSFIQQATARGFEAAGSNAGGAGGSAGMAFLGMGVNATAGAATGLRQSNSASDTDREAAQTADTPASDSGADGPVAKLGQFKLMLDQGSITQADFDAAKNKILGL